MPIDRTRYPADWALRLRHSFWWALLSLWSPDWLLARYWQRHDNGLWWRGYVALAGRCWELEDRLRKVRT